MPREFETKCGNRDFLHDGWAHEASPQGANGGPRGPTAVPPEFARRTCKYPKEDEKGVPKISWNYMYMKGSEEGTKLTREESGLPILIAIDSSSKMMFAKWYRRRENASTQ